MKQNPSVLLLKFKLVDATSIGKCGSTEGLAYEILMCFVFATRRNMSLCVPLTEYYYGAPNSTFCVLCTVAVSIFLFFVWIFYYSILFVITEKKCFPLFEQFNVMP